MVATQVSTQIAQAIRELDRRRYYFEHDTRDPKTPRAKVLHQWNRLHKAYSKLVNMIGENDAYGHFMAIGHHHDFEMFEPGDMRRIGVGIKEDTYDPNFKWDVTDEDRLAWFDRPAANELDYMGTPVLKMMEEQEALYGVRTSTDAYHQVEIEITNIKDLLKRGKEARIAHDWAKEQTEDRRDIAYDMTLRILKSVANDYVCYMATIREEYPYHMVEQLEHLGLRQFAADHDEIEDLAQAMRAHDRFREDYERLARYTESWDWYQQETDKYQKVKAYNAVCKEVRALIAQMNMEYTEDAQTFARYMVNRGGEWKAWKQQVKTVKGDILELDIDNKPNIREPLSMHIRHLNYEIARTVSKGVKSDRPVIRAYEMSTELFFSMVRLREGKKFHAKLEDVMSCPDTMEGWIRAIVLGLWHDESNPNALLSPHVLASLDNRVIEGIDVNDLLDLAHQAMSRPSDAQDIFRVNVYLKEMNLLRLAQKGPFGMKR